MWFKSAIQLKIDYCKKLRKLRKTFFPGRNFSVNFKILEGPLFSKKKKNKVPLT